MGWLIFPHGVILPVDQYPVSPIAYAKLVANQLPSPKPQYPYREYPPCFVPADRAFTFMQARAGTFHIYSSRDVRFKDLWFLFFPQPLHEFGNVTKSAILNTLKNIFIPPSSNRLQYGVEVSALESRYSRNT